MGENTEVPVHVVLPPPPPLRRYTEYVPRHVHVCSTYLPAYLPTVVPARGQVEISA